MRRGIFKDWIKSNKATWQRRDIKGKFTTPEALPSREQFISTWTSIYGSPPSEAYLRSGIYRK
jgi:hypothetical protein